MLPKLALRVALQVILKCHLSRPSTNMKSPQSLKEKRGEICYTIKALGEYIQLLNLIMLPNHRLRKCTETELTDSNWFLNDLHLPIVALMRTRGRLYAREDECLKKKNTREIVNISSYVDDTSREYGKCKVKGWSSNDTSAMWASLNHLRFLKSVLNVLWSFIVTRSHLLVHLTTVQHDHS